MLVRDVRGVAILMNGRFYSVPALVPARPRPAIRSNSIHLFGSIKPLKFAAGLSPKKTCQPFSSKPLISLVTPTGLEPVFSA